MRQAGMDFLGYINDLQACMSVDASFSVYEQLIVSLGYDGVNYSYSPLIKSGDPMWGCPLFKGSDMFSDGFMEHYQKGGLFKHDYALNAVLSGQLNTMNWWQDVAQSKLNEHEQKMLHDIREYGLNNGLSIPLMRDNHGMAGATLVSLCDDMSFAMLNAERQHFAEQCVRLFHSHVWGYCSPEILGVFRDKQLANLNVKEKKFLYLLTTGKPLKLICEELNTTVRYGDKVLASLRHKFGNISRSQLLYYAGLLRIDGSL